MASNSPGSSQGPSTSDFSTLPRGLLCRRGVPVARGARLPTLRSPRDLTLGGSTKRTFTPNIPARREKKDEVVKAASGASTSERGRGNRRNQQVSGERGRGRGRGNNFIQLQGSVFGEGISVEGGRKRGSFGQSSRDESASKAMQVPKFTPNNKAQTKEEKEEEDARISELLRDDFVDDWNDDGISIKPVQLPLLVKEVKVKTENDVKDVKVEQVSVKREPQSDEESEPMEVDGDVKPRIKMEDMKTEPEVAEDKFKQSTSPAKLFSNDSIPESGQLLFFQFPDCLPGASAKSDEDPRIKKEHANQAGTSSQPSEENNCVLSDLPEGLIGKLQVLKSGRTRLLLGPLCLNVELGTSMSFLQDLVSVRIKEGRDPATGDMFVLGHVQEKLVCLPDMETLLKNIKKL